ncbi:hypothetical protein HGRIS_004543 [Hohenbuehelia grisea]|uniref:Cytochrome P450 n=1 Tax=Hohenbuehelia grisea TaxID=104357 RepID=A0ABR3JC97_9AGAR
MLWFAFLIVVTVGVLYRVYSRRGLPPLPPGPAMYSFPLWSTSHETGSSRAYSWLTYAKWRETFGDLIYLNVFGNPLLILNSASSARDLLDKRSAVYSSRPTRTMQAELMGFDFLFSGMQYGPMYREHRAMFQKYFQPRQIREYHPILLKHASTLVLNLSHNPKILEHHLRRTSAAVIIEICYGHHVADQGDEYVTLADEALSALNNSAIFGSYLVDYVPMLKHLPSWMPGAGFKRQAQQWRQLATKMLNYPFDKVKANLVAGTAEACLLTQELSDVWVTQGTQGIRKEAMVKNVGASAYSAGVDTTMSTLMSFFLAMTLHPEIQAEAQRDIDSVVPGDRLPTFSDRSELPVVDRIMWELFRWNPSANIALAHLSTEDDEYRGWRIPKGTTVLANIWSMLHDEEQYPNPQTFDPSRYLKQEQAGRSINPVPELAFGFGRRICPGRFLALDSIWIIIATVLSVYEITKARDTAGNVLEPQVSYTSGLISRPKTFPFRLVPRASRSALLADLTELSIDGS